MQDELVVVFTGPIDWERRRREGGRERDKEGFFEEAIQGTPRGGEPQPGDKQRLEQVARKLKTVVAMTQRDRTLIQELQQVARLLFIPVLSHESSGPLYSVSATASTS